MVNTQKGGKMKGGILNSLNTLDQNNTEMSVASQESVQPEEGTSGLFSNKNVIIMILCGLLIMSFLGMNLFLWVGIVVQFIAQKVGILIATILGWIGFYTGAAINTSADVVADTAKAGIDIAEGTVHSVGNLLQDRDNVGGPLPEQLQWNAAIFEARPMETESPQQYSYSDYDTSDIVGTVESDLSQVGSGMEAVLKTAEIPIKINIDEKPAPTLDETINTAPPKITEPVPEPVPEPSKSWCLVGELDGRRSCTQVDRPDMCMSGQIYNSQSDCLDIHPKSSPLYKDKVPSTKYMRTADVVRTRNWGIVPPQSAFAPPIVTNRIPLVQQPPVQYNSPPQTNNLFQSQPIPTNPYSAPIATHPIATHPIATHPIATHPIATHPMLNNRATQPMLPTTNYIEETRDAAIQS